MPDTIPPPSKKPQPFTTNDFYVAPTTLLPVPFNDPNNTSTIPAPPETDDP
jgi:hypothetical protein